MGTVVGLLILLALLAAAGWAVFRAHSAWRVRRSRTPEEKAQDAAVRAAEKRGRQVTREHEKAVRAAEQRLRQVTGEHEKAVKAARKELQRATTPKKLGRFKTDAVGNWKDAFKGSREFVLYDDKIVTPSGSHPLTPSVEATVDSAGNLMQKSRSTLTRMGAGAVIAGPVGLLLGAAVKKNRAVDARELFLMVQGEDWADTTNCDPAKEGAKVRAFAQAVNVAARNVERVKAERASAVAHGQRRLAQVEGDRDAIEAAERHLAEVRGPAPALAPAE